MIAQPNALTLFPSGVADRYEVYDVRHAAAILHTAFRQEFDDIADVLGHFSIGIDEIATGGGNKSTVSQRFQTEFNSKTWDVEKPYACITHKVDCAKGRIALEIEWNTKDTFYDRDLMSFSQLFDQDVISLGVIVTRADALQEQASAVGRRTAFGASTTHMGKLLGKLKATKANGCPILVFGITDKVLTERKAIQAAKTSPKGIQVKLTDFISLSGVVL